MPPSRGGHGGVHSPQMPIFLAINNDVEKMN
jgi:hypothetical protein